MAPRRSVSTFPTSDQLAAVDGAIVAQSRVTFSGQRGLVWISWKMDVRQIGAGVVDLVVTRFNSSFAGVLGGTGVGYLGGAAGSRLGLWAHVIALDPVENGFIELELGLSGGSVDILANQGVIMTMSFEAGVGEGPTVVLG